MVLSQSLLVKVDSYHVQYDFSDNDMRFAFFLNAAANLAYHTVRGAPFGF